MDQSIEYPWMCLYDYLQIYIYKRHLEIKWLEMNVMSIFFLNRDSQAALQWTVTFSHCHWQIERVEAAVFPGNQFSHSNICSYYAAKNEIDLDMERSLRQIIKWKQQSVEKCISVYVHIHTMDVYMYVNKDKRSRRIPIKQIAVITSGKDSWTWTKVGLVWSFALFLGENILRGINGNVSYTDIFLFI